LNTIYPEHDWKIIPQTVVTERKPMGYWSDVRNQRDFFDQLAIKLNIKSPEDWNNVAADTVISNGGSFIKHHYDSNLAKGTCICHFLSTHLR
jgi:hypothetical protein